MFDFIILFIFTFPIPLYGWTIVSSFSTLIFSLFMFPVQQSIKGPSQPMSIYLSIYTLKGILSLLFDETTSKLRCRTSFCTSKGAWAIELTQLRYRAVESLYFSRENSMKFSVKQTYTEPYGSFFSNQGLQWWKCPRLSNFGFSWREGNCSRITKVCFL